MCWIPNSLAGKNRYIVPNLAAPTVQYFLCWFLRMPLRRCTYLHKEKQTAVAVLWSVKVLITMVVIPAHQQTTYLTSTAAWAIYFRSC